MIRLAMTMNPMDGLLNPHVHTTIHEAKMAVKLGDTFGLI